MLKERVPVGRRFISGRARSFCTFPLSLPLHLLPFRKFTRWLCPVVISLSLGLPVRFVSRDSRVIVSVLVASILSGIGRGGISPGSISRSGIKPGGTSRGGIGRGESDAGR